HAQRYARVLSARAKIAAVLFIEEQAILRFLEFERKLQPLDVEGSFVKIDEPLDHECVVVGEAFDIASAFPIIAEKQLARVVVKICAKKFCRARRNFQIARLP